MRDSIIIQQAYEEVNNGGGYYSDMLRLTMQRHAAYARSHLMDYQIYFGEPTDRDVFTGAWHKIKMIQDALERGYKYIFWIDIDAAIVDFSQDLRDAFKGSIGCVQHKHEQLPKEYNIPTHLNVGVVFVRNDEGVKEFIQNWWNAFPGDKRWAEQGAFNDLAKDNPLVFKMDDKYNATVNVNMCEKPVIVGWHGIHPAEKRFSMMKTSFLDDHIKFRV
jgi:hypothetical protein